jgi:hypothetical protein
MHITRVRCQDLRRHRSTHDQPSFFRPLHPLIGGHLSVITILYLPFYATQVRGFCSNNNIPALLLLQLSLFSTHICTISTSTHHGGRCPGWYSGQEAQTLLDFAPSGRVLETLDGHWNVFAQTSSATTSSSHCEYNPLRMLITAANQSSSHAKYLRQLRNQRDILCYTFTSRMTGFTNRLYRSGNTQSL